jgi:hypothetical protein
MVQVTFNVFRDKIIHSYGYFLTANSHSNSQKGCLHFMEVKFPSAFSKGRRKVAKP